MLWITVECLQVEAIGLDHIPLDGLVEDAIFRQNVRIIWGQ
jgi:hypothetical protein